MPLTPFISRQDLTDYMGTDVTGDAGALIAVDAACQFCRDIAQQEFTETTDDTLVMDGTGTDALVLPQIPVTAVAAVTVGGTAVTDYVLTGRGLLIRVSDNGGPWLWPKGRQNVTVTYTHGYTEVPSSIRFVALAIANRMVVQGPTMGETVGGDNVRYAAENTTILPTERMILRFAAGR